MERGTLPWSTSTCQDWSTSLLQVRGGLQAIATQGKERKKITDIGAILWPLGKFPDRSTNVRVARLPCHWYGSCRLVATSRKRECGRGVGIRAPNLPGNSPRRRGFRERVSDPVLQSILARGQHHRPLEVLSGLLEGRHRDRRRARAPLLQHLSVLTQHGDRRGAGGGRRMPARGRRTFPGLGALSRGQTGERRRRGRGSHCCGCRGGGRGVDAVRHKAACGAMHQTPRRGCNAPEG